ncbi:MAG: hypothetical protein MK008_11940 [Bdellovibrionales bacterium]|nr:hypothetical protein [Bdellovibrionales bacterium]
MKITLVFITSLLVSIMLQASEFEPSLMQLENRAHVEVSQASGDEPAFDYFSTIKQWFEEGHNVRFEEIEGFYSGRCYREDARNKPDHGVLGVYKKKQNYDHGPAFPDIYIKKLVAAKKESQYSRDSFDDYTSGMAKKTLDNIFWQKSSPIIDYYGTVSSYKVNSNNILAVRRYNNYYVLAGIVGETTEDFKKGYIWEVCYFFKKL